MSIEENKKKITDVVAAEIEAGKLAAASIEQNSETLPEDMTTIDVQGETKFLDLTEVDFDPKWNIRDLGLQEDRVHRKVGELLTDGYIRTPLVVCHMLGAPEGTKPRGTCGFLRYHALLWIQTHEPEFFAEHFAGKIPFKVVSNATEKDREKLLFDHGLEEELDEFEVYLAQKRLCRTGEGTEKQHINILVKMFYKLAAKDVRVAYNKRLSELMTTGGTLCGNTPCKDIADMRLLTFRGQYQFFKRIARADPVVEEHFKKQCRGGTGVKITHKAAEILEKMTRDEALTYLDQIAGRQAARKPTVTVWGPQRLKSVREVTKSSYLAAQLDAALGNESVATTLPDLEEELIKIERAKSFDPKRFWDIVNTLNTEAEAALVVPTPAS